MATAYPLSPYGLLNLSRDRQILTRFQDRKIRQTFPFLSLPAELRNIIYESCIDLSTVEKYFDRAYKRIKNKEPNKNATILRCRKQTPSIFLINRQIFNEAVSLLPKQHLGFHHGLLGLRDITKVISENVLQNISSLEITVRGHSLLQPNILRESWSGLMDTLAQTGTILADGHKLKNLIIDLEDPEMVIHVTKCWDGGQAAYKCDFRDHLKDAFTHLRKIRGVPNVTLKGFPAAVAQELKTHMQSKPKNFLDLPAELRNEIYRYAVDRSYITRAINIFMNSWIDRKKPMPAYPVLTTPTILLLNKRIYNEALPVIRAQTVQITFPIEHTLQTQPEVPELTRFISPLSLQQLQHLSLRIEKWEWVYAVENTCKILAAGHQLNTFELYFRDALKAKFLSGVGRCYPDKALHDSLNGLCAIRGVKKVVIEGDLPAVYAWGLKTIMEGSVDAKEVPKLMGVSTNGAMMEIETGEYVEQ